MYYASLHKITVKKINEPVNLLVCSISFDDNTKPKNKTKQSTPPTKTDLTYLGQTQYI